MHIFLSYASPDKGAAESIAFSLRNRGYTVFLDRDDLPAGQSYDEQIWRAVKRSQFFIFLISPNSVAEGRYALTELKFARRKWNDPSGRVLPVLVRKTPLDTVPSYLKAVTILEPSGNIAAETSATIDDMRQASRLVSAAWRVAAKLPARYRYAIAIGTSCAVAALLAFVFSGRSDSSRFIAPAPAPPAASAAPPAASAAPPAASINCKEEGTLRSLEDKVQTSIVFTNKEDQPIRVYWLDYDGKRIPYGTIGKGEVFSTQTYVTHPWLITDAKDNCKAIYMPTSKRLEVSVDGCKEEGTLRSLEDKVQTSIVFTNKEDQPIRVYWLDYDGKRIPYGTIGKGEVFSTQTYVTHPWLITDAKDNCKAIYMPTSKRLEVSVDD